MLALKQRRLRCGRMEIKMHKQLDKKITGKTAKLGIIGLGYVGLPLAAEFARAGFSVTGFEVEERKVKSILSGKSYIEDVESATVAPLVEEGRLSATADFSLLKEQDIIIVCVPTPLRKSRDPDVSYIVSAAEKIAV